MARKGENIYKRKDGRWEGRYIKGRKPDGRPLYGSIYGRKYGDVKARLIPIKSTYAAAREHSSVRYIGTVRDWLCYWLDDLQKPHIKPSTYASYRDKLVRHVLPDLGDKRLEKLTENDIQDWIDGLTAKGLAGSSVRTIYRIFNAALQKAVYRHYLFVNPCRDVTLPGEQQPEIHALTISQQKELEKQALVGKGNEAVILALYTGMRIGEISALTWDDVDFESSLIYVRRTLQRIPDYEVGADAKTKLIIDIPKTRTSYRMIPFGGHLKASLLEWKAVSKSEYVISCKGHFAEPRVISYRFRKIADKVGLAGTTFHSLRHTYATRCIERGIDVVTLSRLLGHASSKLTLDTYADSTMEQRKYAMAVLDMLLPQEEPERENFGIGMANKQKFAALLMQLFNLDIPTAS